MSAIGIDIGHFDVKIATNKEVIIFPSVVVPCVNISKSESEIVRVNGKSWFIGDAAIRYSCEMTTTGLVDNWIEKPEYSALIAGAIKKLEQNGISGAQHMIVMGLPMKNFDSHSPILKALMKNIVLNEVKVMPQPQAPYYTVTIGEQGAKSLENDMDTESWAVIDVGFYTTDIMAMDRGGFPNQKVRAHTIGVSAAALQLQEKLDAKNIEVSIVECDQILKDRYVTSFNKRIDVSHEVDNAIYSLVSKIIEKSEIQLKQYARNLTGILVAGGGAPLVVDKLAEKWGNVRLAPNSRYAVVEGMRRFGEALILHRSPKSINKNS
jgi:plasmid segregation protein ParM